MTAGLQLDLSLAPAEPIAKRAKQRTAERDRSLDSLAAVREQVIALAGPVAMQVLADQGGVTGPRLKAAMIAAGYGALLAAIDGRWAGSYLNPHYGWRATGERVPEGSKGRRVEVWVKP